MTTLNKKIRANVMRLYLHRIIEINAAELQNDMKAYNAHLIDTIYELYINPVRDTAAKAGIKLRFESSNRVSIRSRGKKAVTLKLFDVSRTYPDVKIVSYPGDPSFENNAQHHYACRGCIDPDTSEAFVLSGSWNTLLKSLIGTKSGETVRIDLPSVDNPIAFPSAVVKKFVAESNALNKRLDELVSSLEAINTILLNCKTVNALKIEWPEGASIIHHGVVRSTNTLPAIRLRNASKVANLK